MADQNEQIETLPEPLAALFERIASGPALSYTDYLAHRIRQDLRQADPENIIADVSAVKWDLHPQRGYLISTKKTLSVIDRNGSAYRITIEDVREEHEAGIK